MPQRQDGAGVRDLLARIGLGADDLELSRALRFDPRDRVAVVATVLLDRAEQIVGLAVADRFADAPDLLLGDEASAPGVAAVLGGALRAHGERVRRIA
jgi:hypothetical protein